MVSFLTRCILSKLPKINLTQYFPMSLNAANASNVKNHLIWVDLEMTGLDVDSCHILEMACIVTDGDLNILAEAPAIVIHQPDNIIDNMNDWCKEYHGKSGLTDAVKSSKISVEQAEYTMLSFVQQYTPEHCCPLAGNTVHMDKRFLDKYMPQFANHLHYRIVDVSTVKELCRRWYPDQFAKVPSKPSNHRALEDIKDSIRELEFYRSIIFR